MNTPMTDVKNSGADPEVTDAIRKIGIFQRPPAAMKVAPATSSDSDNFSVSTASEGTKNSSQTIASETNM